jgi:hypothetical protein
VASTRIISAAFIVDLWSWLLILLFKASPNRVNKFEIIVPRIQNPVLIGTTYKENKNIMSIFVLYVCRSRREALING